MWLIVSVRRVWSRKQLNFPAYAGKTSIWSSSTRRSKSSWNSSQTSSSLRAKFRLWLRKTLRSSLNTKFTPMKTIHNSKMTRNSWMVLMVNWSIQSPRQSTIQLWETNPSTPRLVLNLYHRASIRKENGKI